MLSQSVDPLLNYAIRTRFYRPAIYRTSNNPDIPQLGATVIEFITSPPNYNELELQCLIDRVSIDIGEYIHEGIVEANRIITSDNRDSYVHLYIRSRGLIVVPLHKDMIIPDDSYIPSNQCIEPGSQLLTLEKFKEIVNYWENNYYNYGVVACRPIPIEKGIIPRWWIATIVHQLSLDWFQQRLFENVDYTYIQPQLTAVKGSLLLRVDYSLSDDISRDTGRRDYFNKIVSIVTDMIVNLYDQGAMAKVEEKVRARLQYKLHPSGLYVPTWYDILLCDTVRMVDRCRAFDAVYVPMLPGLTANGIGNRVLVFEGNSKQLNNMLLTL